MTSLAMMPLRRRAAGAGVRPAGARLARPDALHRRHGHRVPGAHRRNRERRADAAAAGGVTSSTSSGAAGDADLDATSHCGRAARWPRARWRCTARRCSRLQALCRRRQVRAATSCSRTTCAAGPRSCMRRGSAPRSIALHAVGLARLVPLVGREGGVRAQPGRRRARAEGATAAAEGACRSTSAVALAERTRRRRRPTPALDARDHCIVELLYGCGLRVGELVGLDAAPSASSAPAGSTRRRCQRARARQGQQAAQRAGRRAGAGGARALAGAARSRLRDADEAALFVSRAARASRRARCARGCALRAVKAGLPTHVHPHMLRHSSRRTCCSRAATCARCRSCSATPTSRRRRSTRSSTSAPGEGVRRGASAGEAPPLTTVSAG